MNSDEKLFHNIVITIANKEIFTSITVNNGDQNILNTSPCE